MRITIDTATDSKEEIIKIIKLLHDFVRNKGYDSNDYGSNYSNSYAEKPKQQEFSLGALNFNDEPKVEAVDFSGNDYNENNNDSYRDDEPTEAEVQELIRRQTMASASSNPTSNSSYQSSQSQPTNAFGAMFGGESKSDILSNNPQFGDEDPDDDYDDSDKEEEKDDDWGPRTNITLADLDRY